MRVALGLRERRKDFVEVFVLCSVLSSLGTYSKKTLFAHVH